MNKIEKLLLKILIKDRSNLLLITQKIISKDTKVKAVKIKNTDFYRVRKGQFRIIFHKNKGEIVIDAIGMRNGNICKSF